MKIRILQQPKLPGQEDINDLSNLILLLAKPAASGRWPVFPYGEKLKNRLQSINYKINSEKPALMDLPNDKATRVSLSSYDPHLSPFTLLELARKHAAIHLEQQPHTVMIMLPGIRKRLDRQRLADALISALLAGNAPLPCYKSQHPPRKPLRKIILCGLPEQIDLRRTVAESAGNTLARELTATPPNELTPAIYRRRLARVARAEGWNMRFLDQKKLQQKGAGAFLAVAQGSPEADAGIVQLSYNPGRGKKNKALALVGKGICFDTGGMNLKPARHMHGMHEDMQGSAVALGTLLALSRLKVPFPVHCWLALAQNHIGPRAYKQNDVITAMNGTTIEVMHTDAEGRMVLADTLALAATTKPGLIIDYATLTGACVYALSTRYSGACSNRDALIPAIMTAGRESGERVWPFPMDEDFEQALESQVADIRQCTLEGEADHILAARFLNRFVKDTPWMHVDLSAGNHKGGLAHIPTDITGFGVRFSLSLLLDQQILAAEL